MKWDRRYPQGLNNVKYKMKLWVESRSKIIMKTGMSNVLTWSNNSTVRFLMTKNHSKIAQRREGDWEVRNCEALKPWGGVGLFSCKEMTTHDSHQSIPVGFVWPRQPPSKFEWPMSHSLSGSIFGNVVKTLSSLLNAPSVIKVTSTQCS